MCAHAHIDWRAYMHRIFARVYASYASIVPRVNACRHGCVYVCMYACIICILLFMCSPCYRNASTHMETYTVELRQRKNKKAITKHMKHQSINSPPPYQPNYDERDFDQTARARPGG